MLSVNLHEWLLSRRQIFLLKIVRERTTKSKYHANIFEHESKDENEPKEQKTNDLESKTISQDQDVTVSDDNKIQTSEEKNENEGFNPHDIGLENTGNEMVQLMRARECEQREIDEAFRTLFTT